MHPRLIDSLLDDVLYLVGPVDKVEVRTVLWPHATAWTESGRCLLEIRSVRFAKIRTSNFRQVVRQHTEGEVGNIIRILLEI